MNQINDRGYVMASRKLRYIIEHGVLGWGWLTASIMLIYLSVTQDEVSSREILKLFAMWSLGGVFFGLLSWPAYKRKIKHGLIALTGDVEVADRKTSEAPQSPK